MFGTIKELILINVQTHEQTLLKFNEFGIHRIKAEGNSHGKTSIMRSIDTLFFGENLDADSRHDIIRWGCKSCIINAKSWNDLQFRVYLHLESKYCFYELEKDGKKIRKYLSDDYKSLIKAMNFHYFAEKEFSLHSYKTKTTLPFTHTSGRLNFEILTSSTGLTDFDSMKHELDKTIELISSDKKFISNRINGIESQLKIIGDTNITGLELKINSLESVLNNYKSMIEPMSMVNNIVNYKVNFENLKSKLINTEVLSTGFKNLELLMDSNRHVTNIIENKIKLNETKTISETNLNGINKLKSQLSNVQDIKTKVDYLLSLKSKEVVVKEVPKEVVECNEKLGLLNPIIKEINNHQRILLNVVELKLSDGRLNLSETIDLMNNSNKLMAILNETEKSISNIEKYRFNTEYMFKINSEVEELKSKLPICDSCGSLMLGEVKHCE